MNKQKSTLNNKKFFFNISLSVKAAVDKCLFKRHNGTKGYSTVSARKFNRF
jgi:hypothetical protein